MVCIFRWYNVAVLENNGNNSCWPLRHWKFKSRQFSWHLLHSCHEMLTKSVTAEVLLQKCYISPWDQYAWSPSTKFLQNCSMMWVLTLELEVDDEPQCVGRWFCWKRSRFIGWSLNGDWSDNQNLFIGYWKKKFFHLLPHVLALKEMFRCKLTQIQDVLTKYFLFICSWRQVNL
jgi:hypothetical protein